MADEHDRGWRARLARRRSTPDDEVRVRPMAAVGWMLATMLAVIGVTAGVWFWLRGKSDIELSAARIALTAGGGAGAGVGLMLAFRRQQHQEKATVLTDRDAVERRINDRYTAAIDQLGSDKLDVRLGGIYALERIAADSRRDHPTVIDVLCTFVREHTRPDDPDDTDTVPADRLATHGPSQPIEPPPPPPAADVQAALTVVGRRTIEYDIRAPDLRGAILRVANLIGANLYSANLYGADLYGAQLNHTVLRGADLRRADLRGADLRRADLRDADLSDANLFGAGLLGTDLRGADLSAANLHWALLGRAKLIDTDLSGADLSATDLSAADLRGADLGGASLHGADLSEANLHGARCDPLTRWPEGFTPAPSAEQTDLPPGDADD